MFEKYTEKAKRILFFAAYEARILGSDKIKPEYILLGLLREVIDSPDRLLPELSGFDLDSVRKEIQEKTGIQEQREIHRIDFPFTEESKKVLSVAEEESERLSHSDVSIAHILLGLLWGDKGVTAQILKQKGLEFSVVCKRLEDSK